MISRSRHGLLFDWWWEIDRVALLCMLSLLAIGLVLAFAASPAATAHNSAQAGNFHYAAKQIAFALVALGMALGASLLSLRSIGTVGVTLFALAVIGAALVLGTGPAVLGARRWIDLGGITFQPSEFLKPGFAIVCAGILAGSWKTNVGRELVSLAAVLIPLALLIAEPDIGQSGLLLALWGAMLFFDGISMVWIGLVTAVSAALAGLAYLVIPHVHHRVDQFFANDKPGFQAGLSLKAFEHGGLAGVGPGAGTIKYHLPYAHSDFIFAVAGEEFGLILCATIALLFCALSVRLLLRASAAPDRFSQLAGAGLAMILGLQAFINMGVAVHMLPAKGMTLPFISYGGSSLFAVALTAGFALGITRHRNSIVGRRSGAPGIRVAAA